MGKIIQGRWRSVKIFQLEYHQSKSSGAWSSIKKRREEQGREDKRTVKSGEEWRRIEKSRAGKSKVEKRKAKKS